MLSVFVVQMHTANDFFFHAKRNEKKNEKNLFLMFKTGRILGIKFFCCYYGDRQFREKKIEEKK